MAACWLVAVAQGTVPRQRTQALATSAGMAYTSDSEMIWLLIFWWQPLPPSSVRIAVDCFQCALVDFSKPPLIGVPAVIVVDDFERNVTVENGSLTFPILPPVATQ